MNGLAKLIGRESDWARLLDLAIRHRLVGVLYRALESGGMLERVPFEVRAQLRVLYLSNCSRAKQSVEGLASIVEQLERAGITTIVVKGPALAMLVYSDLGARDYFDIDLLVHPEDFVRAAEILLALDFQGRTYNRAAVESGFFSNTSDEFSSERLNRIVDLHSGLRDWYFPFGPDEDALWSRTESIRIDEHEFRTLGAADCFLFLCAHASKHGWPSLAAVADLANLLRARPELDQAKLVGEAMRRGYARMVMLGLRLAHDLAGTTLDDKIVSQISKDHALIRTAETIINRMFAEVMRGSILGDWIIAARTIESARDRIRMVSGLIFAPTATDYIFWPMPRSLYPVYYLVRPARLLRSAMVDALRAIRRSISARTKRRERSSDWRSPAINKAFAQSIL
jgi:hypothetical protein